MVHLATRYEKAFYIDALTESSNVISNTFLIWDIEGDLDPQMMQQAISQGFNHSCFHYKYRIEGENIYKELHRENFHIPYLDLTDSDNPNENFKCLVEKYYYQKISLDQNTLFKACLCKLDDNIFKVIVMSHHICLDGMGFQLFFADIKRSYTILKQGKFLDPVIDAQLKQEAEEITEQQKNNAYSFWQNALKNKTTKVEFNHAINPENRKALSQRFSLDHALSQSIKYYCKQSLITPNIFFKGLYALLVGRIANQSIIAITSPMNRRTKDSRFDLGCFVNTRLDVYDTQIINTLEDYWHQIRQFNKAIKPYGELPYAELINFLKRNCEQPELMVSNIAFGSTVGIDDKIQFDDKCLLTQNCSFVELNADIQLLFCESSCQTFNFRFDYLAEFTESGLFDQFLQRLKQLIEWALIPQVKEVNHLPLLTTNEFQLFNKQREEIQVYPELTLAQLFHQHVLTRPQAIALVNTAEDSSLSYEQLHSKVAELANTLQSLLPNHSCYQSCIAINLDCLHDTVIAILATQYCGLAFTCVDASAPAARKKVIMEQLQPLVLIGDAIPLEVAFEYHHLPSISYFPMSCKTFEPLTVPLESISQYIFTSGTTGQPKAVALSHRALVSTLYCSQSIPIGQRILYSANEAFDAASLQLWLAFIHGKALIVPQRNTITHPEALEKVIGKHRVDHLFLTTGLFDTYMSSNKKTMFDNIETLVFGGDSVSKQAVRHGLSCNIKNLVNIYGPTEACIYVTAHHCRHSDLENNKIPIGQPRPNIQTFVVDGNDHLLGCGMIGHIIIAGDGLAEGYFGNVAENKKFCSVHIEEIGGKSLRVYRTGDFGYWRKDGTLIFCGRRDDQVKLRGYRIELDEIRQAIESFPGVELSSVILKTKATGKQLLAYYQSQQSLDSEEIIKHLKQLLPEYMIPSHITHMLALPLSRNGKIDRHALPDPVASVKCDVHISPIQEVLLAQAAIILELPHVNLQDDFIQQGGDSISAILLSVRLEEKGLRLSTADIMKYRLFSDISRYISTTTCDDIISGNKKGSFPLLPAQQWFFSQNFPYPEHFNQAVTLRIPIDIDDSVIKKALNQLTGFHDAFWLRFDDSCQQHFTDSSMSHYHYEKIKSASWSAVEQHIATTNLSINLKSGPLFKAVLFDIAGESAHYLYLCAHHLIVDGVSWRRIVSDLQSFYVHGNDFKPSDYSNMQSYQSYLVNHSFEQSEIDYWLTLHETIKPAQRMELQGRTESKQICFTAQQTTLLLGPANTPFRTQSNELMLCALHHVFRNSSAGLSILLEGHGRKSLDKKLRCDASIGWFTSIFPVHLSAHTGSWSSRIKHIKQILRNLPSKGENFLHAAYNHSNHAVRDRFQQLLMLPISFNFLGRFNRSDDHDWHIEQRYNQYLVSEQNKPLRQLDINAWVCDEQLCINMELAGDIIADFTLDQLCTSFYSALIELNEHCCHSNCPGGLTPCDIPDIALALESIETIEQHFGRLDAIYPATDFQRELLYFNRVNADYQIDQLYFELEGDLSIPLYTQAWTQALLKHDILRAGFFADIDPAQPLTIIPRHVTLPLQIMDWRDCETEKLLCEAILQERKRPFHWHQPPLLRLLLARTDQQKHILIFTFHHVLFDGWSMQIFLNEIMQDYERLKKGEPLTLEPLSFAPFPRWLSDQQSAEAHRFWQNYLADAPMNLRIQPDQKHRSPNTLRIQSVTDHLTLVDSQKLRQLASQSGATLNQLCQLAWAATLANYTRSKDIVFGTTLTKRPMEISRITERVGLFVATPPIRLRLEGTVKEMITQIRDHSEQRVEHAFYDLNQYDAQWKPTAPFGTLFVFENYPEKNNQDNLSLIYRHKGTVSGTNHQIVLCLFPGDELSFSLFYDNDELTTVLAEAVARDFLTRLQKIITATKVDELL